MASKAILIIGIAVAIVIFMGPLGTLDPTLKNTLTSVLNPSQQGENTGSEGEGASASSQDGDLSAAEGGTSGGGGNAAVKEPTKEEQQSAQQTQPGNSQSQGESKPTGSQGSTGSTAGSTTGTNIDTTTSKAGAPFVRVMASKFIVEEDYTAIGAVILGPIAGSVNPNTQAARVTMDLVFENIGDASTSSVKFDGVFHVDGLEVKRVSNDIGRLDIGQKVTRQFTYTVKISEIPPEVINRIITHVVEDNHPVFSFDIKNIDFAKS